MRNIIAILEYHMFDILVGSAAIFICYAFARMVGARVIVALTFAILPFFIARAYNIDSPRELLVALMNYN